MIKSNNLNTLSRLKTLNKKIKQQNKKEKNLLNRQAINILFFASNFKIAKPYYNRLLKRPKRTSVNEKAKEKLKKINVRLQKKNTKHYYLINQVINPLTKEDITKA